MQASIAANTYVVSGPSQTKSMAGEALVSSLSSSDIRSGYLAACCSAQPPAVARSCLVQQTAQLQTQIASIGEPINRAAAMALSENSSDWVQREDLLWRYRGQLKQDVLWRSSGSGGGCGGSSHKRELCSGSVQMSDSGSCMRGDGRHRTPHCCLHIHLSWARFCIPPAPQSVPLSQLAAFASSPPAPNPAMPLADLMPANFQQMLAQMQGMGGGAPDLATLQKLAAQVS